MTAGYLNELELSIEACQKLIRAVLEEDKKHKAMPTSDKKQLEILCQAAEKYFAEPWSRTHTSAEDSRTTEVLQHYEEFVNQVEALLAG